MKNLRLAQKQAWKKNKVTKVIWRGYTDVVKPTEKEFTTADLRCRLLKALREIVNKKKGPLSEEEGQVIKMLSILEINYLYLPSIFPENYRFLNPCPRLQNLEKTSRLPQL